MSERIAGNEREEPPFMLGERCYNADCDGAYVPGKDDLDCDRVQCSNYPATCDEAVYSYEQSVAYEKAYYAANPDAREAFRRMRGFYPGDVVTDEVRNSWPGAPAKAAVSQSPDTTATEGK